MEGIFLHENESAKEILSIDHPDIVDFLTRFGDDNQARQLLTDYDESLPRVLEDLIDILIRKNVLQFTEFPETARRKLVTRQYLRNLIRQTDRTIRQLD